MSQPRVSASSLREVVMLDETTPEDALVEALKDRKPRLFVDLCEATNYARPTLKVVIDGMVRRGEIVMGWARVNGKRMRAVQLKK